MNDRAHDVAGNLPPELRRLVTEDMPSVEACRKAVARMPKGVLDQRDALLAIRDDTRRARGVLAYACIAAEINKDVAAALQKAERIGVCARDLRWTGIGKVARALMRVRGLADLDERLPKRLITYANFAEFIRIRQETIALYREAVKNRPRPMIRAAISLAAIACCAHIDAAFPDRVLPEFFAGLQQDEDLRTTVEIIVGAMSMLISDAHHYAPFTPIELMVPVAPYIYSMEFVRLIEASVLVHNLLHVRDLVSLTGYIIEKHEAPDTVVYNLAPCDLASERARWLGFLMRQAREARYTPASVLKPRYSDLAGPLQCELVQAPYPRYRHTVPEMMFFENITSPTQELHVAAFRRESLIDVVLNPSTARVGETGLDQAFGDVTRLKRMAEISSALLVSLQKGNRDALLNSFVAALEPEKFSALVGSGDVGQRTARSLDNLTWEGEPFVDLFYTPILKVEDHKFVAQPIVHAANLQRSLLWRNTRDFKRLGSAAEEFPAYIADLLRGGNIGPVTTDREIKSRKRAPFEQSDLDVVLLHENTLWFFECKFNLFSATTYEERDLLQDIEKAASQVNRALRILQADPERTLSYVRSWFPDLRFPRGTRFGFRGGILLSTGEYSGTTRDGVPVRDVFSLRSTLQSGQITWSAASPSGGDEARYAEHYWSGSTFTYEDFVAYWSSSPPVLTLLQNSLVEYTSFTREGPLVQAEWQCSLQGEPRAS